MKTPLCQMLGMDVPVFQAAIGGISCPALAAAVSNAGGMGAVAMTGWGAQGTRQRIARTRQMTDRGFVANLLLSYDIDAELNAILEDPPAIVSFFWGDVARYVPRVRAAGARVMANVGSIDEAKRAAGAGADIIVAQGWEAGGHVRGTTATLALVPQVVDAVGDLPVVAAGGIADGRGLAAVLCLGAQAAWIGTRFLSAHEADIHPHYRDRILAAGPADTHYSKLYDGTWPDAPGRVLRNRTIETWEAAGRPSGDARAGAGQTIGTTPEGHAFSTYDAIAMRAGMQGDIEAGSLWAGQGVGLVRRTEPAADIVRSIADEAATALAMTG